MDGYRSDVRGFAAECSDLGLHSSVLFEIGQQALNAFRPERQQTPNVRLGVCEQCYGHISPPLETLVIVVDMPDNVVAELGRSPARASTSAPHARKGQLIT